MHVYITSVCMYLRVTVRMEKRQRVNGGERKKEKEEKDGVIGKQKREWDRRCRTLFQ